MQEVARGSRIPLDAVYRNADDELVDPTTPLVDILDPANAVIVADAVPVRSSLGLYDYPAGGYLVPVDADPGVWTARWTGTVDGDLLEALDEFEVVAALTPTLLSDVELLLGRALTDDEEANLARLLEMGYAIVEGALPGFSIAPGTATDERIVHDDPDVAWTERYPVTAVTEVKIGDAVLSETSYRWTDRGRIELGARCILNEFEVNLTGYNFAEDLTVTYDYGLSDPAPDEVLIVVAQMVAGVLRGQATNPDGVSSVRLGAFEESYGPQGNPGFARIEGAATLLRRWGRGRAVSMPLVRRR